MKQIAKKDKYNLLTVINVTINSRGRKAWYCLCECGNNTIVETYDLTHNKQKSCGCLARKKSSERLTKRHASGLSKKPNAARNDFLRSYKANACVRNLDFQLTDKEFDLLINQVCRYCGQSPEIRKAEKNYLIANGIDRLDNGKGYTTENCVSCCKTCNLMKLKMTPTEYIQHCKKVEKYATNHEKSA